MLGAGLGLLLVAMRLVAAAFSCSFSPFGYLPLPGDHGWRVLLLLALAAASAALLSVVLRDDGEGIWLPGVRGGVLVPSHLIETLLRDLASRHPDVAAVDVRVRVRGGRPRATLDLALRPLAPGEAVAADVRAVAHARLTQMIGSPDAQVTVRPRVLTVKQLVKVLP